jgi:hypothetical protein
MRWPRRNCRGERFRRFDRRRDWFIRHDLVYCRRRAWALESAREPVGAPFGTTFSSVVREPAASKPLASGACRVESYQARVAELADAPDSKSGGRKAVWVQLPPRALLNVHVEATIAPLALMEISHMKNLPMGLFISLVLYSMSVAAQKDSTFTGEISDRYCAKANSHEMMMKRHNVQTTKDCIPACVKAGGAYVLVDASTKTIYELDDQQKPARFAEQKVKVTGTFDKGTQTIHVTDIQASK